MATSNNSKALVYCAVWGHVATEVSLELQSTELQTYCLMHGLEVVDIISDSAAYLPGQLRLGIEQLIHRAKTDGIGHIIIYEVSRIGREGKDILTFLQDTFESKETEIHIYNWKMRTGSDEGQRFLSMAAEIIGKEFPVGNGNPQQVTEVKGRSEKLRLKPLWTRLFRMLQDERYAEILIKALFQIKDSVHLSESEYVAVHGGYDHLILFRALGFRIKGEKTDNTKLVTDVLVLYWDTLKGHIGPDLHKIIEGSETGAIF
jgi:Resolvase, N terminal domain